MSEIIAQLKFDAVVKGARAILEQKDFAKTAREIFDHCRKMTGAQSGYVALLNEDGSENEVLFLEAGGLPCDVDPELPMPIRGLRAIAYRKQEVVYENDFMHSEWVQYMPDGHVLLHNIMFSPLNIESKTVGVMGLANKPCDFTEEDSDIARIFGDLAAIALKNSRYLEKIREKTESLERALAEIRTLRGILPMCASCKKIRDDKGYWNQIESYIRKHSDAEFSHGICPDCVKKLYPEYADNKDKNV
jgi:GAF domain-containing protein